MTDAQGRAIEISENDWHIIKGTDTDVPYPFQEA